MENAIKFYMLSNGKIVKEGNRVRVTTNTEIGVGEIYDISETFITLKQDDEYYFSALFSEVKDVELLIVE